MPMFPDPNNYNFAPAINMPGAGFSPLKANLDDMVLATDQLRDELDYFVDDAESFGVLTEDTFLENAPQVLKLMQRISALLRNSTTDLTLDDEMFGIPDSSTIVPVIYNFLSSHRRILNMLLTTHAAVSTAGPYAVSLGRSISQQRQALEHFKGALDSRDAQVKARTADEWHVLEQVLASTLQGYAAEIQNAEVQDGEWENQRELVRQQRETAFQGAMNGLNGNNDAMD